MTSYNLTSVESFKNVIVNNASTSELLTVNYYKNNDITYKIVKYDKNFLCRDLTDTIGLFRSVILDENNNILSIIITTSTIERKKTINDQLINYTLTFELSIKNNSQR